MGQGESGGDQQSLDERAGEWQLLMLPGGSTQFKRFGFCRLISGLCHLATVFLPRALRRPHAYPHARLHICTPTVHALRTTRAKMQEHNTLQHRHARTNAERRRHPMQTPPPSATRSCLLAREPLPLALLVYDSRVSQQLPRDVWCLDVHGRTH